MTISTSLRRLALASGLAGVAYLVGWGRGSRWTRTTLSDPARRNAQSAPHWS